MDVFRFPFVLRLGGAVVMSDRNGAEWLHIAREAKELTELGGSLKIRIYSCPNSSKSKCFGCKKEVLGGC